MKMGIGETDFKSPSSRTAGSHQERLSTPCMASSEGDSLHSKRFRLVSEQRNTEEGDFRF